MSDEQEGFEKLLVEYGNSMFDCGEYDGGWLDYDKLNARVEVKKAEVIALWNTRAEPPASSWVSVEDSLKWAYCGVVGADSIVGLDSCSDYKEWLESLAPPLKEDV